MRLHTLENSILKDFTYYELVIFPYEGKPGNDYPIAYKTLKNAEKTAYKLFNTGKYYSVMVRRNEVLNRVPGVTYWEINSPLLNLEQGKNAFYYEGRN